MNTPNESLDATHPHWLFVYGTLKRGHGNNRLLQDENAVFIGPALTKEKFLLNDGFPFVWANPDDPEVDQYLGIVRGELYRVNALGLARCDALEGHPTSYCRTPIRATHFVDGPGEQEVEAGIYLMRWGTRHMDLQMPDEEGFLEWGRNDLRRARDFQRLSAAKHRSDILRRR